MTGSWTIDAFIIGCIILIIIPLGIWFYREVFQTRKDDKK